MQLIQVSIVSLNFCTCEFYDDVKDLVIICDGNFVVDTGTCCEDIVIEDFIYNLNDEGEHSFSVGVFTVD